MDKDTKTYFDLKADATRAEMAVPTSDRLLVVTGPYATDDPFEVAALNASEGVKIITADEYRTATKASKGGKA